MSGQALSLPAVGVGVLAVDALTADSVVAGDAQRVAGLDGVLDCCWQDANITSENPSRQKRQAHRKRIIIDDMINFSRP